MGNDGAIDDVGMFQKRRFDGAEMNTVASYLRHEVDTTRDLNEAFRRNNGSIASSIISLAVDFDEAFCGEFRVGQIAGR